MPVVGKYFYFYFFFGWPLKGLPLPYRLNILMKPRSINMVIAYNTLQNPKIVRNVGNVRHVTVMSIKRALTDLLLRFPSRPNMIEARCGGFPFCSASSCHG